MSLRELLELLQAVRGAIFFFLLHHFTGPVVIWNPFLNYYNYKTMYLICTVRGQPPFEVTWLYSQSAKLSTNSTFTIITGKRVSNRTTYKNGTITWKSYFRLYAINSSTAGYYYCRINSSFGLKHSKPLNVRNCKFIQNHA